jgi:hypothetical protein
LESFGSSREDGSDATTTAPELGHIGIAIRLLMMVQGTNVPAAWLSL